MSATLTTPKTTSGGEIIRELVNASDGQGLHFENNGYVDLGNVAAAKFGTSDFSVEFVLNQTAENSIDNYIYFTNISGKNRAFFRNDISENLVRITFSNSSNSETDADIAYNMSADYGTPTHYVLTFDRDGDATLYKNGSSVGSVNISAFSAINLGDDTTQIQRFGSGTNYGVLGTFYRFRTWNKALSSAEVQTAFERADVDYADQYGSQSELVTNGTFAADSTWTQGTGWSIAGGAAVATSAASGVQLYQTVSGLTIGKKYRLSFEVSAFTSGSVKAYAISTAYSTSILSATGSATVEFTATATSHLVSVITQSASTSLSVDNVSVVQIGAVVDLDLAFANPTQSLMVQDRSGTADGTASSSTLVTQVQPVVQLNSTSARIGTSAGTPADRELLLDKFLTFSDNGGTITSDNAEGEITIAGGNATNNGGNISLRGGSHGTPNTIRMRVGGTTALSIASDGNIEQHTDSNGIVKFGVKNESTGTAARAMVNVLSDSGNLDLSMNGSNYTGVAGWADSGTISTGSGASGGLKMNAVVGGLALQTNQTTRLSIADSTGSATFTGDTKLGDGLVSNYVKHVAGLDDTVAISFTFPSQSSRYIHQMLELRVAMGDDGAATATPTFLRYAFSTLTTASGITQMDASLGTGITASTSASGTTFTVTLTEGSAISMDSVTVFATVTSGHTDAKCTGMTVA